MLNLASETDERWLDLVLPHLDVLLLDHAHCEKKAASTAVGLIFRYPEYPQLALPLSELAREELEHFELVVKLMRERGQEFRRLRPSPYAARLLEGTRGQEPHRLLDTLLCCALIEARSCERMKLLSERLPDIDAELAELYGSLLASEARHHRSYVDLARACELADEATIKRRLAELAEHEARVLAEAPSIPRMHN